MSDTYGQTVLSPDAQRELADRLVHEAAVAQGSVYIDAAECAQRLGYRGPTGLRRLRAETSAGLIQGIKDGQRYKYHWPSVQARIEKKKAA